MFGKISGVSSSTPKREGGGGLNVGQLLSRYTATTFARPQSFRFLYVESHKTPKHSAPIENEDRLTSPTHFCACETEATARGPLTRRDSRQSDVSVLAVIQVEVILSTWFELFLLLLLLLL
jgi:hypothetical protein